MIIDKLKQLIRYEYKLNSGEYFLTSLGDYDKRSENIVVFNVKFVVNFKTYLFCNYNVINKIANYEFKKIITIDYDGNVFEFLNIEDFVEYCSHDRMIEKFYKFDFPNEN